MIFDLEYLAQLPLRGKTSVMAALNPRLRKVYYDWDISHQAHNHHCNVKAKNSKAKHRKRYRRRG